MIFPNISFFHMVVNYWTGPLNNLGLLICNQAKILIVRLDALNHHNNEPRYILREDLFRQIVLHQLKPCFQNLFENM